MDLAVLVQGLSSGSSRLLFSFESPVPGERGKKLLHVDAKEPPKAATARARAVSSDTSTNGTAQGCCSPSWV